MSNEIFFSKQYEYMVDIYHDSYGNLGSGTLHFGGGKFAHVNLNVMGSSAKLEGKHHLKAKAKSGEKFTLTNCTYQNYTIHSDLMICGEIDLGTSEIAVKYSDISDWFMFDQHLNGVVGESISWTSPPPRVEVTIENEDENFYLRSEIEYNISKRGENYTLHQHVDFSFLKTAGKFNLSEIKNKPHELSCLLSILTAQPISISSVWVMGSAGHLIPAYFPAFKRVDRDFDENQFWRNSLISRHSLDTCWQTVLERYYNSTYRKVYWVRLAGMQRYEGFWEYKVLGYVSLLDGYSTELSKSNNIKPKNINKEVIDSTLDALKSLKNPLTSEQIYEIKRLIEPVLPMRRKLNFTEKYNYVIDSTDPDIVKIINLSNDDFKLIKKVRDKIAHGDAIDLVEAPLERVHSTIQKLTLLLTFRALNDFGITTETFIKSLSSTTNSLRYCKELNMTHLSRIIDPNSFFSVSKSLFNKISNTKSALINACFTKDKNGTLEYSEKYVEIYRAWEAKKQAGSFTFEDIFGIPSERVTHIGTAFLNSKMI